ncbi:MAG: PTS sugar transporter subunit IIA [Nitrospinota bacterium]
MENKENSNKKFCYLIIAHGSLASALLETLKFITPVSDNFMEVEIDHEVDVEQARLTIKDALAKLPANRGIIVFTDLFGGAPSNIALSLIDGMDVELIAGVNLPMLLQAAVIDEDISLEEMALKLRGYGQDNIFLASDLLSKRSKPGNGGSIQPAK